MSVHNQPTYRSSLSQRLNASASNLSNISKNIGSGNHSKTSSTSCFTTYNTDKESSAQKNADKWANRFNTINLATMTVGLGTSMLALGKALAPSDSDKSAPSNKDVADSLKDAANSNDLGQMQSAQKTGTESAKQLTNSIQSETAARDGAQKDAEAAGKKAEGLKSDIASSEKQLSSLKTGSNSPSSLRNQADKAEKEGNTTLAQQLRDKADKTDKDISKLETDIKTKKEQMEAYKGIESKRGQDAKESETKRAKAESDLNTVNSQLSTLSTKINAYNSLASKPADNSQPATTKKPAEQKSQNNDSVNAKLAAGKHMGDVMELAGNNLDKKGMAELTNKYVNAKTDAERSNIEKEINKLAKGK